MLIFVFKWKYVAVVDLQMSVLVSGHIKSALAVIVLAEVTGRRGNHVDVTAQQVHKVDAPLIVEEHEGEGVYVKAGQELFSLQNIVAGRVYLTYNLEILDNQQHILESCAG